MRKKRYNLNSPQIHIQISTHHQSKLQQRNKKFHNINQCLSPVQVIGIDVKRRPTVKNKQD